jgi:integrating conjugative element protein (TIGR03752 family)
MIDVDKLSTKGSTLSNPHLEEINPRTLIEKSKSSTYQEFGNKKSKGTPYYTMPAGSDLAGMNLLSALIGEVPLGGKIEQPLFPFSAMVGRGALMAANGVPLPQDIKGMKVGGYAIGVGSFLDNISCTRAYVTSALFVFEDGHFETVGEEKMHSASQMVDEKAIGYMTDEYGNPCIHGTYFTNAPRVLAAMSGAAGVQGAGNALSQWQMSYVANGNGGAAFPTGSIGKYALGGAIAQGSVKASEWLEERIKGSFDMVFVPASKPYRVGNQTVFRPTRLTLHLTKTIEINKNMQGRRISYGHNQNGIHDYSLK